MMNTSSRVYLASSSLFCDESESWSNTVSSTSSSSSSSDWKAASCISSDVGSHTLLAALLTWWNSRSFSLYLSMTETLEFMGYLSMTQCWIWMKTLAIINWSRPESFSKSSVAVYLSAHICKWRNNKLFCTHLWMPSRPQLAKHCLQKN